jgi:periplasmic divalent cation tolerance protein
MDNSTDFRIVFITVNSFDTAVHISKIFVSEKLAACCSIIPHIVSYFAWNNVIQERHEIIVMIKTKSTLLDSLEERIMQLHHDEVPEIIAVNMDSAYPPYLEWMKTSLS